jgi:hypothetical protein
MEVLMTGMHRSGTSMLARMLTICGLYLGPQERLMPPKQDNPEGFWEHLDLVYINEQLLDIAGGAWDWPPVSNADVWSNNGRVTPYRNRAREIIDDMRAFRSVGIKDPRLCLTLPFWLDLCPGAKTVICLRNPVEVAESLKERNGMSELLALGLWFSYYSRVIAATQPSQRLVANYRTFFDAPHETLQRINEWLGLSPSNEAIEQACSTVKTDMIHHQLDEVTTNDLLQKKERYQPVKKLYARLLEEAKFLSKP